MLREEVKRKWTNLFQRLKKEKLFANFLYDKFDQYFSDFAAPLTKTEDRLEYLVNSSHWYEIQKSKDEVAKKSEELLGEEYDAIIISYLEYSYYNAVNAFMELAGGWWREKRK